MSKVREIKHKSWVRYEYTITNTLNKYSPEVQYRKVRFTKEYIEQSALFGLIKWTTLLKEYQTYGRWIKVKN